MRLKSSSASLIRKSQRINRMVIENRIFFVTGFPRSGTTALARLLNASRSMVCIIEGNVINRFRGVLSRRQVLNEPYEDLCADLYTTVYKNFFKTARYHQNTQLIVSPPTLTSFVEAFRQDLKQVSDTESLLARLCHRYFRMLGKMTDFRTVGEKVPDYIDFPHILYKIFPTCRILFIQRDPRAVVHSILNFIRNTFHLFAVPNAFAMAFSWLIRNKTMDHFISNHPGLTLKIAQERLKSDPKDIAERTSEFLGVSLDAQMTNFAKHMMQTSTVKNWQSEMADEDIMAVEGVISQYAEYSSLYPCHADPLCNPYAQKAASLTPLSTCSIEKISHIINNAVPLFRDRKDKQIMGLTLLQFGDYAHRQVDFDRAYLLYSKSEKYNFSQPQFWFKWGELCFDMKLLSDAKKHYTKALSLMSGNNYYKFLSAKSLYQLGRIERLEGRNRSAVDFFYQSLNVFPSFYLPKQMLKIIS
ncbi:MAG: sulfotransferase [Deltaproteobacteria bacterium]|nr:sulfotransferase [Deltaproteobacteria bacterium]MBW1995265.1 sulfotransferase [Deltaproteobacteria bacterium]MBW2153063.1 sulfotransferase [Deltaproteobacteria bacterium]